MDLKGLFEQSAATATSLRRLRTNRGFSLGKKTDRPFRTILLFKGRRRNFLEDPLEATQSHFREETFCRLPRARPVALTRKKLYFAMGLFIGLVDIDL